MGKIETPHELGHVNSMFKVEKVVMPLVFGSFYSILYHYTIKDFPGVFYLVCAAFYSMTLLLFI